MHVESPTADRRSGHGAPASRGSLRRRGGTHARWVKIVAVAGGLTGWGGAVPSAGQEECGVLTNCSFEIVMASDAMRAAGWSIFWSQRLEVQVESGKVRTGSNCLKMGAQGIRDAHAGAAQTVPVQEGRRYVLMGYVTMSKDEPLGGSAYGALGIEWKNEAGCEISRVVSPPWNKSLSRMRWECVRVEGEAPKGAVQAVCVVYLYDGDSGGSGACLVDDLFFEQRRASTSDRARGQRRALPGSAAQPRE